MRCFIHQQEEAISVCKKCGKAMCVNCSAYSNHSGICPECRRDEFVLQAEGLRKELSSIPIRLVGWILFTIVLAITVVGLFIGVYKIVKIINEKRKMTDTLTHLDSEIAKLNKALQQGKSII
ncbi:MAG: hypothetical protein J6B04_02020 [Clostridia bacterium]|nr:hypothetical protein [Clostridia bacterium]